MSMRVRCQHTSSQTSQWIGLEVWGLDTAGTTGPQVSYQRVGVWGLTLEGHRSEQVHGVCMYKCGGEICQQGSALQLAGPGNREVQQPYT